VSNVGAGVIGDAIFIPGGYEGQSASTQSVLQAYYPFEDRVETITSDPLPAPRFGAGVAVAGNKLYVIGGSDDTLQAKDTLFVYDPAQPAGSRWQTKASMPTARVYLAAATVNGVIYAAGGLPGSFTDLNTVEAYNPATDSWSTVAPMSIARGGLALVGVDTGAPGCGGYLYAIGGGYLDYTASAERYDPAANVWAPISNLTMARRTLGGVYSPNTYSLMAFGGWNGSYEARTEAITCEGGLISPSPTATVPVTPSSTPSACEISFEDVPPGSTFYTYVQCLACEGIINGYPCGGAGEPCNGNDDPYFRPNSPVTRGQLTKIVAESAGFDDTVSGQTFEDIAPGSTFYTYTERLVLHQVMNGYPCGGAGEPCNPPNSRPYFRPNSGATRGQLTKIVSNAAGFDDTPQGQTFEDVQPGSTFYTYTQRLTSRGVMNGYPCGGVGEPCNPPDSRPYFRPNNNVTRGQTSKIVGITFFPACSN
jgi:N-acetylneuraminic acid mutarotase